MNGGTVRQPAHRRCIAIGLGALLVAASLGFVGTPHAEAWTRSPVRVAGGDRYATAVELSRITHPAGAQTVVIASGENYPDGLVGGPLAALLDAPLLLTARQRLPDVTASELRRLAPEAVMVLGGPSTIDGAVLTELLLATGVTAERIAGPNRYATAAEVASRFPPGPTRVLVASGAGFADALAGGTASAGRHRPLLLTQPNSLPAPIAAELQRLDPGEVVVLGGPASVQDSVVAEIAQIVPSVRRLAGGNRYATAASIANDSDPAARQILLATGLDYPDALAAAVLSGRMQAPLLLTHTSCAPNPTVERLVDSRWPDLTIIGGPSTVSAAAMAVVPCTPVPDGPVAAGLDLESRLLAGPRVVRILTVDRRQSLDIRAATATGRLDGRRPTTEIARRWNALAAVNGDFFLSDGQPVHALASAGRLLKAPGLMNSVVAFDARRPAQNYLGRIEPSMAVTVEGSSTTITVHRVNDGVPATGDVAMFTTEASGVISFEGSRCVAALQPANLPALDQAGNTTQGFTVRSRSCGTGSFTVSDADVLVAHQGSPGATQISELALGSEVTFRWRLHPDWTGVMDAIGSNLRLVTNGTISTDVTHNSGPFFDERAPRTAVGWLADGRVLLVTVDGRQSGYSIGMTPHELADFMLSLGVVAAANLDGGGSTTMARRGVLANRPSDSTGERSVGSALLVLPQGTML